MSKQTTVLNTNQTNNKQNYYVIDIIRVVLAIIILNFHCYSIYFNICKNMSVGGGWLVCDAFFMISGFFVALSASKKESIAWYKFGINRVLKLLPLIVLVYVESVLFSLILFAIQGKQNFFQPLFPANAALWFIWFLWFAEIPIYAVLIYCKKSKLPLIISICLITFVSHILLSYFSGQPGGIKNMPEIVNVNLSNTFRSFSGVAFGVLIYQIVGKLQGKNPNKFVRTLMTIIGLSLFGAVLYLMFCHHDFTWRYVIVTFFFIFLLICFSKIGWISSKIVLPNNVAKFCRDYSLILYLYHNAIIGFLVAFNNVLSQIAIGGIAFGCCLAMGVLMTFVAPKFNQVCQNLFAKIALSIKKKKEA